MIEGLNIRYHRENNIHTYSSFETTFNRPLLVYPVTPYTFMRGPHLLSSNDARIKVVFANIGLF